MIRNARAAIATVHIARKALQMDEDTYRALLTRVTGKPSCAQMNTVELATVLNEFKRLGFEAHLKPGRKVSPRSRHKAREEKTEVDKIRALWIALHQAGATQDGSEAALSVWIKRQTAKHNDGLGYESVTWVPVNLLPGLIEQLKKWRGRYGA